MRTLNLAVVVCVLLAGSISFAGSIDAPVAYWALDETSGKTANDSAGNNDGTVINGTWTAGKIGGALNFSSGYVDCGDDASLDITGLITVSGWIKTTMTTESSVVAKWDASVTNGDGLQTCYDLLINHNGIGYAEFHLRGSNLGPSIYAISTIQVNDGMWHLVTGVYDGSFIKLYVDGLLQGSTAYSGGIFSAPGENVYIGNSDEGAERIPFTGLMDDVRIYDYALSASEVYQLRTVPEPTTMALLMTGLLAIRRNKK
jgi:hypothetical protein